ncbi:hypothetical protein BAE44_0002694 [Dichanthelium oligosanthes]|uniref:Uncharacterized protein n=1 Tax=Dichanthelium oligosanthes TaxID=888268 RepID=A0A1E5WFV7_9POAL|nr:hypothetical protein BAE44_0002694 [Dichanthelium oligosanthes]
MGIVAATLGGIPVAKVAGSGGRVASAAFQILDESLTKMSAFQIIIAAVLKRAARRASRDMAALKGHDGTRTFSAVLKALSGGRGPDPAGPHSSSSRRRRRYYPPWCSARPIYPASASAPSCTSPSATWRAPCDKRDNPAAVADLHLLVAFLAARDGRFNDALERYVAMERADPSAPRPHYLAHLVCRFDGRSEKSDKWLATYNGLATGSSVNGALITLTDELVVALALCGSLLAFDGERYPVEVSKVVGAAASRVDVALVSALRDKKKMFMVEVLEIRAIRASLHAGVWLLLRRLKSNDGGNGRMTD